MKAAGAPDEVVMSLAGWTSTEQLRRYGRSQREARAVEWVTKQGSVADRAKLLAPKAAATSQRVRGSTAAGQ
jgi:hypothetical protein